VFHLSSKAFDDGEGIPTKYTCEGDDISPPLTWSNSPAGTQSFALILEDPEDATAPGGVFAHWIIFNIPPDICELPENIQAKGDMFGVVQEGGNDFGKNGYGGPCPDGSGLHKYRFTLYALNQTLSLEAGISKQQVLDNIQGHILAQAELRGVY